MDTSVLFHAGELAVQNAAGEADRAARVGEMIDPVVPLGVQNFLRERTFAVLATVDTAGQPTASIVYGRPGFLSADGGDELAVDWQNTLLDPLDPVNHRAAVGSQIGMIAMKLNARLRYRVNGRVTANDDQRLTIAVEEAFGNCTKYIQARALTSIAIGNESEAELTTGDGRLSEAAAALATSADTFFIASHGPHGRADISHRGGQPGFVRIEPNGDVLVADYRGNSLFNTLGNLSVEPLAGLLFPDFGSGWTLQVAGRVSLDFDQPDPHNYSGGTGRFWRLTPSGWRRWRSIARPTWELIELSPANPIPT